MYPQIQRRIKQRWFPRYIDMSQGKAYQIGLAECFDYFFSRSACGKCIVF